jgi:hypothetical protein
VAVRSCPVPTFRTLTETPGKSAPFASCTTPLKLPVGRDCALVEAGSIKETATNSNNNNKPDGFLQLDIKALSTMELISFSCE